MDFQNRAGGKTGGGGVASWSESNRDRRERLRQLALETIDLNKDPYFMKNHLGNFKIVIITLIVIWLKGSSFRYLWMQTLFDTSQQRG